MSLVWPWAAASIVIGVMCVATLNALDNTTGETGVPMAESHEPTAYAQAINVVEVHAGQPTTREFIVQSKQALAENHRRIHGVPPDAR